MSIILTALWMASLSTFAFGVMLVCDVEEAK